MITDASRIGYAPERNDEWNIHVPGDIGSGIDEAIRGHDVGTSEPDNPRLGHVWLDTSTTGTGTANLSITTKTSAYTAMDSDAVILCDASSAAFTITLPAASGRSGRSYYVKKIDSSSNIVTVDGNGSETIDGSTTAQIATQYDSIHIVCDGTEWWII